MNGIHDMGGMHGFGPVMREENEPVFHAPWEARLFAIRQRIGFSKHLFCFPPLHRRRSERSTARYSVKIALARRLLEPDIAPSCIASTQVPRDAQARAERVRRSSHRTVVGSLD